MATTYSVREKENKIKKRPWTQAEDTLLISYISSYGEGRWDDIAKCSGLQRNGKSCRLRWVNYLRPDLKRTKISQEEERLLVDLHKKWGNRWSRIARYLPGRTDNEIKNFFRSYCRRKLKGCKERNGNKESIYGSSISVEKIPSLEGDSNVITNQYKDSQVFQNSGRTCHSLLESSCISDFSDGYEVSFLNSGTSSSDISSGKVFIDFTDQLWTIQEDCIVSST